MCLLSCFGLLFKILEHLGSGLIGQFVTLATRQEVERVQQLTAMVISMKYRPMAVVSHFSFMISSLKRWCNLLDFQHFHYNRSFVKISTESLIYTFVYLREQFYEKIIGNEIAINLFEENC